MVEKKKIIASKNKANDVETKLQEEKLWSEYGKLALQRNQALALIRQVAPRMNELYIKIMALEKKKRGDNSNSSPDSN